ncbi:MAG: DUF1080 domain-containing protein [Gemmatimonadales bacterium]|jgi:hypothetical protein|nr:MAG: DUF1080 domain-containing protein [Gemmatimonadales bacterium]
MTTKSRAHTRAGLAFSLAALSACGPSADAAPGDDVEVGPETSPQEVHNTLTEAERAEGWRLLFDGETLEGWRVFGREEMSEGWAVVDGSLTRVAGGARDIITVDQFRDFELTLEWMVEEGGNSGIFIRASEEVDRIFEGAPEMQVLDDPNHVDGGDPLTSAGANYALHPAPRGVVRPAGEWNQVRVRVQGNQVTHWLNGQQIVDYELWSDDWKARLAESKFTEWPEYGTYPEGHIGLQDHGDWVAYRNIKIRELS